MFWGKITIKEMALFPPQGKNRIRQDEEMFALWHSHFETEVRHMVKTVNECLFSQCLRLIHATHVLVAQGIALSAQS